MNRSPLFQDSRPMNALRLLSRRRMAAAAGAVAAVAAAGALLGYGGLTGHAARRRVATVPSGDSSGQDVLGGIMDQSGAALGSPGGSGTGPSGGSPAVLKVANGSSPGSVASNRALASIRGIVPPAMHDHLLGPDVAGALRAGQNVSDRIRQVLLGLQQTAAPGAPQPTKATQPPAAGSAGENPQGDQSRHTVGGHKQDNGGAQPAPPPPGPSPAPTAKATPTSTVTPVASPSPSPNH